MFQSQGILPAEPHFSSLKRFSVMDILDIALMSMIKTASGAETYFLFIFERLELSLESV